MDAIRRALRKTLSFMRNSMNTAGVSLEMTVLATEGKKQQEDLEASEQCIQFLNLTNYLSIIILPNSCYRSITLQLRTTQRSR